MLLAILIIKYSDVCVLANLLLLRPQILQTSSTVSSASLCGNSKWSRITGQRVAPFLIYPHWNPAIQSLMKLTIQSTEIADSDCTHGFSGLKNPHSTWIMQSMDLICVILSNKMNFCQVSIKNYRFGLLLFSLDRKGWKCWPVILLHLKWWVLGSH